MTTRMYYEDILKIFRRGTATERTAFVDNCPSNRFKDSAKPLVKSDNSAMQVIGLKSLSSAYCYGENTQFGEELSRAGHEFARQVHSEQGEGGAILLYTVSAFAQDYLNALNLQGKFDKAIEFADSVIPYYEGMNESTNLPEIRIKKIAALFELNRIDEADQMVKLERKRGTSSLELDRLEKEIIKIKEPPTKTPQEKEKTEFEKRVSTEKGHEDIRRILDRGTDIMTKSSAEMNEWKAKKIIRDATSIFMSQPGPEEIKKSLSELQKVREWTKDNGTRIDDNDALWGLYLCNNRLKKYSEAADMLQSLRNNIEDLRAGIADPLERGGVSSKFPYLFPALCKMLAETRRVPELLDSIEGAKGRAIADILSLKEKTPYDDREFSKPAEGIPDLMRKNSTHYLTFFVDECETYAVLVAKDGTMHSAGCLQIGKVKIRNFAEKVDPRCWNKKDRSDMLSDSVVEGLSEPLSILFEWLGPFFENGIMEEGDHICYSPDEHLHHIPLQYAHFRGSPIVEKFSLSRIHGAHALSLLLNRKPVPFKSYLSIEVPTEEDLKKEGQKLVKNLHRSVETLDKRLHGKTIPLSEATMQTLLKLSLSQSIVHFSTHGIFPKTNSNENPFHDSGLVMASGAGPPNASRIAQGKDFDYVLTPEKVLDLGLDFSGSHVTLQSCVSGLANEGIGGDALGMEWAFIQAGASSILSSHWYVSAKLSAEFFDRFYNCWFTNKLSKAKAWRQAILELKNTAEPFNKPYCWSAFSLSGDWR